MNRLNFSVVGASAQIISLIRGFDERASSCYSYQEFRSIFMPQKVSQNPADYILSLDINGLEGRMLHVPAPPKKDREILIVYGHHAMLERWWGLIQNYNELGSVTMPDLPGFGGMDSFAKIGRRPTIDAFADYLAAFIKLRYKRKRVTIVGISFGFLVATRMLQKYPELSKKVVLLVSIVGFMHKDDFLWTPTRRKVYQRVTRLFATRPVSFIIRYVGLNKPFIKTVTSITPHSKHRFIEVTPKEFDRTMDFETKLWKVNDVRTHWLTTSEFLNIDNCTKQIALPVYHVASESDHYFDNGIVKQHMLVVFESYHKFIANSKAHTPSILADKQDSKVFLPNGLRRVINKS
jgi:pimeloyl-ACP methyl ester carboxylesterase